MYQLPSIELKFIRKIQSNHTHVVSTESVQVHSFYDFPWIFSCWIKFLLWIQWTRAYLNGIQSLDSNSIYEWPAGLELHSPSLSIFPLTSDLQAWNAKRSSLFIVANTPVLFLQINTIVDAYFSVLIFLLISWILWSLQIGKKEKNQTTRLINKILMFTEISLQILIWTVNKNRAPNGVAN